MRETIHQLDPTRLYQLTGLTPRLQRLRSERRRRALERCMVESAILSPLGYIERIQCRLHLMVLTGPYEKGELKYKLGKLKYDRARKRRMPGISKYRAPYFMQLREGRLRVYLFPKEAYLRQCLIMTSDTSKRLIQRLAQSPDLSVSKLEYAIDVFCLEPQDLAELFWAMKRSLWVPYCRTTRRFGAHTAYDPRSSVTVVFGSNVKM